jgi:hypothetical protein
MIGNADMQRRSEEYLGIKLLCQLRGKGVGLGRVGLHGQIRSVLLGRAHGDHSDAYGFQSLSDFGPGHL